MGQWDKYILWVIISMSISYDTNNAQWNQNGHLVSQWLPQRNDPCEFLGDYKNVSGYFNMHEV